MKKRVGLKIYGRVQGVFFRDSTRRKAKELNLTGWVENEPDGTVQIVAEGEEKDLKELIEWCRHGGPASPNASQGGSEFARVDKMDVEWLEPSGQFNDFMVK